jgi:hypothetical protein
VSGSEADRGLRLLCRNRVEDPERWRRVFDEELARTEHSGLRLLAVWQEVDDPQEVHFLFAVEDRATAEAFLADPAGAQAGERAGVVDGEVRFVESWGGDGGEGSP